MKEMLSSYLAKLARKAEDDSVCSPEKRITALQESPSGSLRNKFGKRQEKEYHHAANVVEKRKKQRIPFIALALGILFTSLGIFFAAKLPGVAFAHNTLVLDATATVTYDASPAPEDQSVQNLLELGDEILGPGTGYDPNNCSHPYATYTNDKFCWNEVDFTWADRDVTCIKNQSLPAAPGGSWSLTMVDYQGNGLNVTLPTVSLNQNTCLDNSICVSNNQSGNDDPSDSSSLIHDQVGGDNILCANKDCINTTTSQGVPSQKECGDSGGPQREYDRFACQATSNTKSVLQDNNPRSPGFDETKALFTEASNWSSTGIYINPTAYNPNGAIYLPTSNLRVADIEPHTVTPECDTTSHWACPNSGTLALYQYNGSMSKVKNSYEEIVPDYPSTATIGGTPFGKQHDIDTPGSEKVPVYWVACGNNGGWAFPCSDKFDTTSGAGALSSDPVKEVIISKDWLSGDADPATDNPHPQSASPSANPGHITYTYLDDTVNQPGVTQLFPFALALGFTLIAPVIVLIGYQFLWASWTLGRANAMEALGRLIMSLCTIAISSQIAAMLIHLSNTFDLAIVDLHTRVPYPEISVNGYPSVFTLKSQGETDLASFRGIVIPISRWGCVANDFASILRTKFITDAVASVVPFVGGFIQLGAAVADAEDVVHHIGEFIQLILTINLCAQVFMRLILLNYYILTGPLAFGCWGLPGGTGSRVVQSWLKGFISLLFSQCAQLFVLATFPLILPPLPQNIPVDNFGILANFLQAIPHILVILAVTKVPKFMGTSATKAIAQAGTVAGGLVTAAAGAAYSIV